MRDDPLPFADERQAVLLHCGEVRPACDERHLVVSRRGELCADQTAHRAGAEDADFHDAESPNFAARPMRCSLPVAPFGISSRNTILRGSLKSARRSAAKSFSARSVTRLSFAQHDGRRDVFAQRVVRHREGDHLLNRRMIHQHFVDLDRRDLLAATIDQLFQPTSQTQIALLRRARPDRRCETIRW